MQAFFGTRVLHLDDPEIFLEIGMFWSRSDPIRPMTKAMIAIIDGILKEQRLEDLMLRETAPAKPESTRNAKMSLDITRNIRSTG